MGASANVCVKKNINVEVKNKANLFIRISVL